MKPLISEFECDNQFDKAEIAWEAVLEELGDGAVFKPLHIPGVEPSDTRPLLIWVHPGDACEDDSPDARIRRRSIELQEAMGAEILARLETHRVIVIQRQSSIHAFAPWTARVAPEYAMAMGQCLSDADVAQVWGDDLDAASTWILENKAQATEVFLTGAWRHPDWGCVTAVGRQLQAAGLTVDVSNSSPSEPGVVRGGWKPEAAPRPRRKLKP